MNYIKEFFKNKERFECIKGQRSSGNTIIILKKILFYLEFNVTSKGFEYWITAILLYRKNKDRYDNTIENIYNEVAKIHKTNRNRVERAMRTARETANNKIKETYQYKGKITNKTALKLITQHYFCGKNLKEIIIEEIGEE